MGTPVSVTGAVLHDPAGVFGAISYTQLSQSEDPPFTFKVMVVRTLWPGASAEEVSRQVTERIEKS